MTRSVLLILALLVGGCNVIGVASSRLLPPPKRPPAYDLGMSAVAVDVRPAPGVYGERGPLDAETAAIALEAGLRRGTKARVVPVVDAEKVIVAVIEPPSDRSTLASGRSSEDATASVRVLDAAGVELWPSDGTPGRLVEVASRPASPGAGPLDVRRATLRALGQSAARLFSPTVIED